MFATGAICAIIAICRRDDNTYTRRAVDENERRQQALQCASQGVVYALMFARESARHVTARYMSALWICYVDMLHEERYCCAQQFATRAARHY